MIAFDNSASLNLSAGFSAATIPASGTLNYSVGAGLTGGILFVFVTALRFSGAAPTISGITYGGHALTQAKRTDSGTRLTSEVWYLVNPPSGANPVVVSGSFITTFAMGVECVSLSGVSASSPINGAFSALSDAFDGAVPLVCSTISGGVYGLQSLMVVQNSGTTPPSAPTALSNLTASGSLWSAAGTDEGPNGVLEALGYNSFGGGSTTLNWTGNGAGAGSRWINTSLTLNAGGTNYDDPFTVGTRTLTGQSLTNAISDPITPGAMALVGQTLNEGQRREVYGPIPYAIASGILPLQSVKFTAKRFH